MAKVLLDPKFNKMNGRMGDLVLYKWKGKSCARVYVVPRNPDTMAQRANRNRMSEASKSWRNLPEGMQESYNLRALRYKNAMSGFNLYISDCLKGRIVSHTDNFSERDLSLKKAAGVNAIPRLLNHSKHPLHMDMVCAGYSREYGFLTGQIITETIINTQNVN